MGLLLQPDKPGYPAEYLLSRIRARRSRMIGDWKGLLFEPDPGAYLGSRQYAGFARDSSQEGLWRSLIKEYRWVYFQMNEQLRVLFTPYFLYAELRTLFIALRHLTQKTPGRARDLPDVSLLSNTVKDVLLNSPDAGSAIKRLEGVFLSLSPEFKGAARIFETDGLRSAEQYIANTCLTTIMADGALDPLLRAFFARLIDARNILTLYKYIRHEQRTPVSFPAGGTIPEKALRAVQDKRDLSGVLSVIRGFSKISVEIPGPSVVEVSLYRAVTRFVKKQAREPLGPGTILQYLWNCSIEVMNLSILFSSREIDREAVSAELVV